MIGHTWTPARPSGRAAAEPRSKNSAQFTRMAQLRSKAWFLFLKEKGGINTSPNIFPTLTLSSNFGRWEIYYIYIYVYFFPYIKLDTCIAKCTLVARH